MGLYGHGALVRARRIIIGAGLFSLMVFILLMPSPKATRGHKAANTDTHLENLSSEISLFENNLSMGLFSGINPDNEDIPEIMARKMQAPKQETLIVSDDFLMRKRLWTWAPYNVTGEWQIILLYENETQQVMVKAYGLDLTNPILEKSFKFIKY